MTEAASLNFGPAWLRDSFTSNTGSGEGPPGSGSSGGPLNYNSQQNNSGWDIASSRSSHGHGGKSNNLQQSTQSNHQMNLHVGGQQSSGASSILSALKLGNIHMPNRRGIRTFTLWGQILNQHKHKLLIIKAQ